MTDTPRPHSISPALEERGNACSSIGAASSDTSSSGSSRKEPELESPPLSVCSLSHSHTLEMEEVGYPDPDAEQTSLPNSSLIDKEFIPCVRCGKEFVFTGGEWRFYQKNNLTKPKHCKPCREERKLNPPSMYLSPLFRVSCSQLFAYLSYSVFNTLPLRRPMITFRASPPKVEKNSPFTCVKCGSAFVPPPTIYSSQNLCPGCITKGRAKPVDKRPTTGKTSVVVSLVSHSFLLSFLSYSRGG